MYLRQQRHKAQVCRRLNHDALQNSVFEDAHSRGVLKMLQYLVLKLKYEMAIVSAVKSTLL